MTYETIQGDTWDMIAYKVYTNESLMSSLIHANAQHASTVVFSAGIVLSIPPAPADLLAELPPWKR